MIGKVLGHFRVIEQIGAGGMGVVYRARDEHLGRDVAIKVLPAGILADEDARRHFRREAETLSKLNHAHIAVIYDFDTQEGIDFLVMEYVPGQSLAEKLRGGSLPEKVVVELGEQIGQALQEAHEHGVVHRDLKPGNVVVTPKGQVKVLDFGLAKMLQPATEDAATAPLTQAHRAAGTLPYMAPEQLRGDPVDERTDIWSLGTLLFEMATGKRPFDATISTRVSDDILHAPPHAPRTHNPRLSAELERIILKCLEKDAENRYQSAKEAIVDLRRLRMPTSVAAAPRVPARGKPARLGLAMGAAAIVVVGALVALDVGGLRSRLGGIGTVSPIGSLAVLPLENLSRDPQQEYFADGMTEALITDISRIQSLRVISRTSVMQYKGAKKPLPQIARELNNVDAVLEGSVQRSGDRVQVTVQLIHAATDRHLWAESYERDLRDVLTLQKEIARAIAGEIRARLTPHEEVRLAAGRAVNPEAHETYLLGRHQLRKVTREGTEKAIEYFQQAIQKDANHALAYAGLSEAYDTLSTFYMAPREAMPKAKAAGLKAVELDESLADAHASLGFVTLFYDWDWSGAEKEFRRALELNPSLARAHIGLAVYLATLGRLDEALQAENRAAELDPLSLSPRGYSLMPWFMSRRYAEALQRCQRALQIEPRFAHALSVQALTYSRLDRREEALASAEKAEQLTESPPVLAWVAATYAESGKREQARKLVNKLIDQGSKRYVCGYSIAGVYAALGEKELAYQRLEEAFLQRSD